MNQHHIFLKKKKTPKKKFWKKLFSYKFCNSLFRYSLNSLTLRSSLKDKPTKFKDHQTTRFSVSDIKIATFPPILLKMRGFSSVSFSFFFALAKVPRNDDSDSNAEDHENLLDDFDPNCRRSFL